MTSCQDAARLFALACFAATLTAGCIAPDSAAGAGPRGAPLSRAQNPPRPPALSTSELQRRIDLAHAAGGGTVVVPKGRHVIGTIVLRSGVRLHIPAGAALVGSRRLEDYPLRLRPPVRSRSDRNGFRSLIYAGNAENITLSGGGLIDGRGAAFACGGSDTDGRPRLIQMIACRNVRVEGLRLRNAAHWMQHYLGCENLRISGLRAWNHAQPNNDFLVIEGCRAARVSRCKSDTDDDGIVLKSGCAAPCEDVVVTDCVIRTHCNAIKLGTESNGGFRNITVSRARVLPSRNRSNIHGHPEGICGIALASVDGGTLERVDISDVALRGVRVPLFIRLGNRARPFMEGQPRPGIGALRDVTIRNLSGTGHGSHGAVITGLPGHPVRNLLLSRVSLGFAGGYAKAPCPASVPEKPADYPEATMFGHSPAWGLFFRHVRGLSLEDVRVWKRSQDARPAFVFWNVK